MKKSSIIIVVAVLVLSAAFVFIDESLTPETKVWLDAPLALPDNTRGRALVKEFEDIIAAERQSLIDQRLQPSNDIVQACMTMGQTCFELLVSQPVERRNYLPQDPRYYETFAAIMEESVLSTDPSELFSVGWQNLIIAPHYVFLNSLVERGNVDPLLLAKSLEFSRRMMKDTIYLTEKNVFASMFSASIAAANMAMGLRHLTVEEVLEDPVIDPLLIPLKEYEQSYSRVMMGEIRFVVQAFENDFTGVDKIIVNLKRNALLNRQHSLMQPVVEYSELPVEMFWIAELRKPKPSWKDHLTVNLVDSIVKGGLVRDTQHLNLQLTVLRALRRTYRGVSPYIHGEPAPPSFAWKGHPKSDQLCLYATNHDQSDPSRAPTKVDSLGPNGLCMVRF